MTITITPDGLKVDAENFTGGKCLVLQEDLEKYLNSQGIQIGKKHQKRKMESMYATAPGQMTKGGY